ncbi:MULTISPECIES: glycosyltransferase [Bosea]|uniref:glycosyltransferase n=1 Tax=Bosea TaxID=85413 RepID=UPI0021503058|nr:MULTISPECIES: glycosyltransferase [Bosea]MCR4522286.1 glycosyltransferase [Bosea sp. 47.2.35]MDR6828061.1 glycosyltransferase involved in cell wall biosynthesis [Bosea robiniae]MDR6894789.1 glycosyltransferase involved in cell wall biosynthesis [Bosea sp. BE109]MDR7138167.1 glycosyltransferase involved in cell wall biosynthesis [Bosea sp. BE168]MDR7174866.1 glycosyltransferase involved in cell wall biosynthesis [Bosea sp. BE271]
MHVLFVHRAGSGQFAALIGSLVAEGVEVTLITERPAQEAPGVRQLVYAVDESTTQHPALAATEYHLRTGEAVARLMERLKRSDPPDVVLGHIGWGGMLFARDALPEAGLIGYCEYYYRSTDSDLDFGIDEPIPTADRQRVRMRNAAQLLALDTLDAAYAPTQWQRRQYPPAYRQRIAVCHDGIDTRFCRPDPDATFVLPDGRVLEPCMPVVTFVARDLDPYRGYPEFMRAAALLAARRPDALFVVVGGDGSGYGRPRSDGNSWREAMLAETRLGDRIVHIPWLAHHELVRLFQVSAAHVYLTVPFVLSWSLLEAMACGCLVIGSDTEPVKEVIRDGGNGLLVPFHDSEALAERIEEALASPTLLQPLRRAARETVTADYERERCIARQTGWIHQFSD